MNNVNKDRIILCKNDYGSKNKSTKLITIKNLRHESLPNKTSKNHK